MPLRHHSRSAAGSGETRRPPPPLRPPHTEEHLLLEIVCQGRHTSADKLGLPLQVQLQVLLGLAASNIDAWVSLATMNRYNGIPMKMALHSAAIKRTCAAC